MDQPTGPASTISSAMAGASKNMSGVRTTHVAGLRGDMSGQCVTAESGSGPISLCGWASDKTLALFLSMNPDITNAQLGALMKKMEPRLVRD